jgi:hypothetical protein
MMVFICFFVRFSFSLFPSFSPCILFHHILSSSPLKCVDHETGTRRWMQAVVSSMNDCPYWSMSLPWRIHCLLSCCSLFRQYLLGHHSVSRSYC